MLRRVLFIKKFLPSSRSFRGFSESTTLDKIENNEENKWREELLSTMRIFPGFITTAEEEGLFNEVEPYMKRLRYEFSHWDDAIHGYRETERAKWNEENTKIIDRVRKLAFPPGMPQLGLVHVLDLAPDGRIKPHVDSVRFCGDVIAGISLLTDCVMRLTLVGNEKNCREDFLLPRRSLYIMSGVARQKYNHEVLGPEESIYQGEKIIKGRRISIICRSEPDGDRKP
ncbi:alpha-ketoglutarate-dependent dioxygenase alkB homolog 7, mitochondrial [Fopius arisanus]|uniref:Alpha-ketoglutarate-dependent dioxygenase alkB homolog 7, mitochondrial n=1 Tax=Fopius arisanus TaxID=64838 RepID=A0A9R1T5R4_9HYME|nr:PREDICTED: alpha-ketoglutarate-dependent dioxygenase alkB homolog 7, mitochondrial [Fopius arisanus]XP_011303393.1 PREDICTED: alpha-ketoglutarate-dependent dioxygenase alkB homolog 7, mitochondrial [Fopius arisanus]